MPNISDSNLPSYCPWHFAPSPPPQSLVLPVPAMAAVFGDNPTVHVVVVQDIPGVDSPTSSSGNDAEASALAEESAVHRQILELIEQLVINRIYGVVRTAIVLYLINTSLRMTT
ncbi:hypothetical protein E1B28_009097 [Marasmius oreades]|uniref:Uncharacterized protein n=1 Tax=Marasmius oreades TaxID=181124 RepID=A0A9P7RZS6_9AGAR|nr:uncharacterized protein E1B28_009097 [Marasmius oreades]KAG7092774.1 hypothetical protein E1B28_009097 [Marasmius oreades]